MKLDNLSPNKNPLNYLSGVRLVYVSDSLRIYCFVTELAEAKLKFGLNLYQVAHHSPAWQFDVLTPHTCFLSCTELLLLP